MSTLAFFPWLRLKEYDSFSEFKLIPYERGKLPYCEDQTIQEKIDTILCHYVHDQNEPIEKGTLLQIGDDIFTRELTESERNSAFEFAELLSICGLSSRKYFSWDGYLNRDYFKLYVQNYKGQGFVYYQNKRRDGSCDNVVSKELYKVHTPEHVKPLDTIEIDKNLLIALLKSRSLEGWADYYGAITYFNLANTDSIEMPEHTEMVLTVSAFESLLQCRGKGKKLADKFGQIITPTIEFPINECEQLKPNELSKGSTTIRHKWLWDFYNLRSKFAHAEIGHRYPARWSNLNHLLLSSYVFPLVLKCCLSKLDLYDLTDEDQFKIDCFERLACQNHFGKVEKDYDPKSHPWNIIMDEVFKERRIKRGVELLEKMRCEKK